MRTHPIVVVGGGVIGLLTARELALAGHEIRLFDQGRLGREASWAAGGILSPLHPWRYPDPVTHLAKASMAAYPALCESLARATGIDPEWTPSGLMRLGEDEGAEARRWAERFAVPLESHRLADVCPDRGIDGAGLWMPAVAQVRSPRLLQALEAELRALKVAVHEEAEVVGITRERTRLTGIVANGETVAASQVVVCGGAWTRGLLERYGLALPVRPMRGQMIVIQTPAGFLKPMILKAARYLVPRRDGAVLVGSTMESVGFVKETTEAAREDLIAAAYDICPELAAYPVTHQWAGLRPSSPEGVPFIGEHPEIRGLIVNTGHFRNGIVLAPASARLAADLVLERDGTLDPAPYRLDRRLEGAQDTPVLK
ncbi:MAG: glycine oxidase ThiO [Acidiferrobacter sp.]